MPTNQRIESTDIKLKNKRFLILFFAIVNVVVAYANAVFSVEEISRTDYIKAEKECSRYNYLPELKLYGFVIPDNPFDDSVWWFDAESGRYLCDAASPTAINANGVKQSFQWRNYFLSTRRC